MNESNKQIKMQSQKLGFILDMAKLNQNHHHTNNKLDDTYGTSQYLKN